MWQVGSSAMMRKSVFSCRGKDDNVPVLSTLVSLPSSWKPKIAGCASKECVPCLLLHISANDEIDFGGRRGVGGFD